MHKEQKECFYTSLIVVSSKRVTSWFFNVSRAFCSLRPMDWNRAIRVSLSEDTAISEKKYEIVFHHLNNPYVYPSHHYWMADEILVAAYVIIDTNQKERKERMSYQSCE